MTNPWDRRKAETDKAWIAFVSYRDLPPGKRSVEAALKAAGRPPANRRSWERMQTAHDWTARARAWDAYVDRRNVQPVVAQELAEMKRRHLVLGRNLQVRAQEGVKEMNPKKLRASEIATLARVGVDIERVTVGEPTEIQRHDVTRDARSRLRDIFGDAPEEPSA